MESEDKESQPSHQSPFPKVGMVFQSEDEAYDFYNQYAKSIGFSIRKDSSTVRHDGTIIRRVLCCSKQGYYKNSGSVMNLRARTRTGCEARIIVLRRGEKFLLIEFKEVHNHELVAPSEVYRLRSQRKIEDSQGETMRNMFDAGMGAADIYSSMCKTFGGAQHLSFTKIDCVNYLQKFKSEGGDVVKSSGCKRNSMVVDSNNRGGYSTMDDPGASTITECNQASTSQCNDLAHLALAIVAKGNSSEDSVVFTRRLLTQVLEELDFFLKSDYDKARQLIDIRDMNHEMMREGENGSDEVDASVRLRDLKSRANVGATSKTNGKLEKGKGKKKIQKTSKGSCDRASIGVIGKTLLLLQDSSTPPKHHDNQALSTMWYDKLNLPSAMARPQFTLPPPEASEPANLSQGDSVK